MNPGMHGLASIRAWVVLVLLGGALGTTGVAGATEWRAPSSDSALSFADQLFSSGDPEAARIEYRRVLSGATPTDTLKIDRALDGVARSWLAAGRAVEVVRWAGSDLVSSYPAVLRRSTYLTAATAALRLNRPGLALALLNDSAMVSVFGSDAASDRRHFLAGIAWAHSRSWARAGQEFSSIPSGSPFRAVAASYAQRASLGSSLPRKSPARAAWLGLVPGLGYAYTGFRQTGVAAFLVNAIFAEAAREAFRHDQVALGAFVGVFGASWYAGSIYGSAVSARRINQYGEEKFLEHFEY